MEEQNSNRNISSEVFQIQQQSPVAAITNHNPKMKKKDSILEGIYLSFGYKPPTKDELSHIICLGAMLIFFVISLTGFCVMWFTEFYNHSLVNSFLVLTENSSAADMWINPPVNNLLKVHIFNYTNIDSFLKGEDNKIRLKDLGPYTYEQIATKVNVKFNDNYTVTFNEHRHYKFRPELSNGNEMDEIVVPNVPLLTAVERISRMSFFMRMTGETAITLMNQNAFDFHNTHEFLWGYKDKIISFCKSFIYPDLPETFGMMQNRNGTSGDTMQIYTGEDDLDKFGLVSQFNGMSKLDFWKSDECNRIDGSDSSQFPPHLMENREDLYVFTTGICRKLPLRFSEEITILDDIDVWRYKTPLDVFSHPSVNPENICYCQSSHNDSCLPSGIFNGTLCYRGAPIFLSLPHFFAADSSIYENLFEGIRPDAEKHQTYADIHPRLAFPINGASRMQINIRLTKGNNLKVPLQKIKDGTFLPILWLEITVGEMSEDLRKTIFHSTFSANVANIILKYGTLLILMVTVSIIAINIHKLNRMRTNNKTEQTAEIERLNKPGITTHC